jgi:hypothetical protein
LTFPHPGLYWIYGNKDDVVVDDDDDDDVSSFCHHQIMISITICCPE